jgi:hypothetical protein
MLSIATLLCSLQWGVVLHAAADAMPPDPPQVLRDRFPHGLLRIFRRFHRGVHPRQAIAAFAFGKASQLARSRSSAWGRAL